MVINLYIEDRLHFYITKYNQYSPPPMEFSFAENFQFQCNIIVTLYTVSNPDLHFVYIPGCCT